MSQEWKKTNYRKASFRDFIWFFSVSGLVSSCCGCRVKTQKMCESQQGQVTPSIRTQTLKVRRTFTIFQREHLNHCPVFKKTDTLSFSTFSSVRLGVTATKAGSFPLFTAPITKEAPHWCIRVLTFGGGLA